MEKNKVHNINFLENTLPDKCANLIIADPPYFEVKGDFDFIWPNFEAYLQDVEKWAKECKRLLADNGTLFWYGHAKKLAYSQVIFDKYFELENNIVWVKLDAQVRKNSPDSMRSFAPITERLLMYSNEKDGNLESPELNYSFMVGKKFAEVMEPVIAYMEGERDRAGFTNKDVDKLTGTCMSSHWFSRTSQWSLPTCEWHGKLREAFGHGYFEMEYTELKAWHDKIKSDFEVSEEYERIRRPFNNYGKLQVDVLEFSQESAISAQYDHPTQKPETLTRLLVITCSRPGDLVVVPFSGSGTEMAMAIKEGRQAIGFDIDPKHTKTSNDRIQEYINSPKLFNE